MNAIYVDNAATTKLSKAALDAMLPYLTEFYGNPSSLHSVGRKANEALLESRELIAKCLGCHAKELTFTSGGSEADNQALRSAALLGKKQGKTHIISTTIEHHAVLHTLERLSMEGFEITLLPVSESGLVTAKQVEEAITEKTCLVSVMFANNEIGTIEPIEEIGKICRSKGVLFHTDAVQAVGHLAIDVVKQNIDMLSLSAHKFHGPKGIGVLYTRKGISLTNLIDGGAQERGKRAGTENIPAIVGMAKALEEATKGREENQKYLISMREKLISGLSEIEHSVLNGEKENRLPGNVHFCFEGIEGETLLLLLNDKGICCSGGSACASGSLDPSHVLLSVGKPRELAQSSLRISLSTENTPEEMDYIVKSVKEVVSYLRTMSQMWRDLQEGKQKFLTL